MDTCLHKSKSIDGDYITPLILVEQGYYQCFKKIPKCI